MAGHNGTASGSYASVLGGQDGVAAGNYSAALGQGTSSASLATTAIGRYNVGGGNATSWVLTDPLFEIGKGTSSGARSNAVTVLKSGRTGFGGLHSGTLPKGHVEIHSDSNISEPQLVLKETASDYARLSFMSMNNSTAQWHIAGGLAATNATSWLNFWYSGFGDALMVRGDGYLKLGAMGAFGGTNPLCTDTASGAGFVGRCSSSLRYKRDVDPLGLGLATLEQLRPVAFTVTTTGQRDIGFIAEEVARVSPLLATYDETGRPESVRYLGLTAVLTGAVQEQARTIREQRLRLDAAERELGQLRERLARQERLVAEHAESVRAIQATLARLGVPTGRR